jgi:hypothetical protein
MPVRMVLNSEKKRLLKSKHISDDIKQIGDEIIQKPLNVIGSTLIDIAEVIKKKYQAVFKGVLDINRAISKVKILYVGSNGIEISWNSQKCEEAYCA